MISLGTVLLAGGAVLIGRGLIRSAPSFFPGKDANRMAAFDGISKVAQTFVGDLTPEQVSKTATFAGAFLPEAHGKALVDLASVLNPTKLQQLIQLVIEVLQVLPVILPNLFPAPPAPAPAPAPAPTPNPTT